MVDIVTYRYQIEQFKLKAQIWPTAKSSMFSLGNTPRYLILMCPWSIFGSITTEPRNPKLGYNLYTHNSFVVKRRDDLETEGGADAARQKVQDLSI